MTDDFDTIINEAKRIVGTSRAIASDVFPKGAVLRCGKCGYLRTASREECARYLSTGWPLHCNATVAADPVKA